MQRNVLAKSKSKEQNVVLKSKQHLKKITWFLASARAMAIMAAKKDFLRFQKHIL
jgi:hypothetical protein